MVLRSCAAFCIEAYRGVFTKEYDTYDEPGKQFTLKGTCVFCDIAANSKKDQPLWYEDDEVVVFEDIKPGAALHALAIPKRHIRDINHLKEQDILLVERLEQIGKRICEERGF